MIEIIMTGAGRSLADAILERLEGLEGDFRMRLCDGYEAAGEARRFGGRTLNIELESEVDLDAADLVLDLGGSYSGDVPRFRPHLSGVSMFDRLVPETLRDQIEGICGSIREPASEIEGGVEALAGQVTELFNGRDPDPKLFGGTLAFNGRILDEQALIEALKIELGFSEATVSLERVQSDCFYTTVVSVWLDGSTTALSRIKALQTEPYRVGAGMAPDAGRVDAEAGMRISVRDVSATRIHVHATADLERTLWAQDAYDAVCGLLERTH